MGVNLQSFYFRKGRIFFILLCGGKSKPNYQKRRKNTKCLKYHHLKIKINSINKTIKKFKKVLFSKGDPPCLGAARASGPQAQSSLGRPKGGQNQPTKLGAVGSNLLRLGVNRFGCLEAYPRVASNRLFIIKRWPQAANPVAPGQIHLVATRLFKKNYYYY